MNGREIRVNSVGSSSESTSIKFEASVEMFDGYLICMFNTILK